MSTFDVLDEQGTARLVRFLGLVALFVTLHLIRLPLLLLARGLTHAMRGVDARVLAGATSTRGPRGAHTPPRRPAPATSGVRS